MEIPKEIIQKAVKIIVAKTRNRKYPLDDWFSLSDDFDLNLYKVGLKYCAVIYPVKNGEIDTSQEFAELL